MLWSGWDLRRGISAVFRLDGAELPREPSWLLEDCSAPVTDDFDRDGYADVACSERRVYRGTASGPSLVQS
jgi:hypothetical protein